MNRFITKPTIRMAILAAIALAGPALADSAWQTSGSGTYNWDNSGGQNNWSTASYPSSWADNNIYVNSDYNLSLDPTNITGTQTINLNQTITPGNLYLGSSTGTFTIAAGTGGSFDASWSNIYQLASINSVPISGGNTISAPITINTYSNNQIDLINQSTAYPLTLSGSISGIGSVAVGVWNNTGGGLVVLSGNSSYSGVTFLNTSTDPTSVSILRLTTQHAAGNSTIDPGDGHGIAQIQLWNDSSTNFGNNVSQYDTTSFSINSADSTGSAINTAGTHTLGNLALAGNAMYVSGGFGLTFSGGVSITNNGWIVQNSPSTLTLSGSVTMTSGELDLQGTGNTVINGGIVLAPGGWGQIYQEGTGTVTVNGDSSYTGRTFLSNGTLIFNGALPATSSEVFVNPSGTTNGTLILNAASPLYTGQLIAAGTNATIRLTHSNAAGTASIPVAADGFTLQLFSDANLDLSSNEVWTNGNHNFSVVTADSTGLAGTGLTHTLGGIYLATSTMTVSGGAGLSVGQVIADPTATIIQNAGGTLTIDNVQIRGNQLTLDGTGNTIVSNGIANYNGGWAQIELRGSGTTTLNGANTYPGHTFVSNGTLIVNGTLAAGALGIEMGTDGTGGTVILNNDNSGFTSDITASAAGATVRLAYNNAAGSAPINAFAPGFTLQLYSNTALTLGNTLVSGGYNDISVVSANANGDPSATGVTHTLSGLYLENNTVTVTGGSGVSFGAVTQNSNSPARIVNNGLGLVSVNDVTPTDPTLTTNIYFAGTGNLAVNGVISGALNVQKDGPGTLTLKGANTYTGNTYISGGAVIFEAATGQTADSIRNGLYANTIQAANAGASQAIGYLTTEQYNAIHGTSLAGGGVIAKFTYAGDVDLDGKITADDFAAIDASYLKVLEGGDNFNQHWIDGDFDHDGAVTTNDFALIDAAFVDYTNNGPLAAGIVANDMVRFAGTDFAAQYQAALGAPAAGAVPEPASLGLLALGALGLLGRRRR